MRNILLVISLVVLFVVADATVKPVKPVTYEPQFAEGEWKIEMQVPPCEVKNGKPNIEVNFKPNRENPAVVTVECNEMPVGTK